MFDWCKVLEAAETKTSISNEHSVLLLNDYAILTLTGPDALKFMQGQVTCDMEKVDKGKVQFGAHCNHKGRVNSNFYAAKTGPSEIVLRVHKSIADFALNALQKYIVFSKATIKINETLGVVGVISQNALAQLFPDLDFTQLQNSSVVSNNEGAWMFKHQDERFECWLTHEAITALLPTFKTMSLAIADPVWQGMNIAAGVGEIQAHLTEALLPQDLNMHLNGGIAFDKGCYTGQEIIARLHYRGALKKHMYRASIPLEMSAYSGDSIYFAEKKVGMVINSSQVKNHCELLVLCDASVFGEENVHLEQKPTANLKWLTLPYAIT